MISWSKRTAARAAALALALGSLAASSATVCGETVQSATFPGETGAFLPLQDRVGDPAVAAAVEQALIEGLSRHAELVDPARLRQAQRRLRMRDTSRVSPETLARLGEQTSAAWFFSATIHQASRTQQSRAARSFESEREPAAGVPQTILSARLVRATSGGGAELVWAGFEAASGLDDRRLLGLGVIDDPELLGRRTAARLIESLVRDLAGEPARGGRSRPASGGFLRHPIQLGTVALVPFGSVTERDATRSGETVSALALAVLWRQGARLVPPGRVDDVLRRRGALLRGEVDAETRAALRAQTGAGLILTGTVEAWDIVPRGAEPEPRIAFSARLLDAETGSILWWHGLDRGGWDRSHLLGIGRIYAAGALAEDMMRSLVAGFLTPVDHERAGR